MRTPRAMTWALWLAALMWTSGCDDDSKSSVLTGDSSGQIPVGGDDPDPGLDPTDIPDDEGGGDTDIQDDDDNGPGGGDDGGGPPPPGDDAPVPEPGTMLILGGGAAAMAAMRRRKGRKPSDD